MCYWDFSAKLSLNIAVCVLRMPPLALAYFTVFWHPDHILLLYKTFKFFWIVFMMFSVAQEISLYFLLSYPASSWLVIFLKNRRKGLGFLKWQLKSIQSVQCSPQQRWWCILQCNAADVVLRSVVGYILLWRFVSAVTAFCNTRSRIQPKY